MALQDQADGLRHGVGDCRRSPRGGGHRTPRPRRREHHLRDRRRFKTAIALNTGIGPYSGKEVIAFSAWFGSRLVLHFALRTRELNLKRWFGVFLAALLVAVLPVWPPVFEAIAELF